MAEKADVSYEVPKIDPDVDGQKVSFAQTVGHDGVSFSLALTTTFSSGYVVVKGLERPKKISVVFEGLMGS